MSDRSADFWIDSANSSVQPRADIRIAATILTAVEPLDAQRGVFPVKSVPDDLHRHLFPQPPEASQLYAILDGAKIDGLPELLAASGVPYRCLFKGKAEAEFGNVAPWLVELQGGDRLLRQLLTRSDARQHLWNLEAALYLRSSSGLDAVWRHLRRFSQLQDDAGQWTFFRFWQADILLDLLVHDHDGTVLADAFMAGGLNCQIDRIIGFDRDGEGAVVALSERTDEEPTPVPRLEGRLSEALIAALRRRRSRQIADMLRKDFERELAEWSLPDLRRAVDTSLLRMQHYRFTSLPLLYTLAAWELFYGPLDRIPDPEGALQRTLSSYLSEQRKFRRVRDRLMQLQPLKSSKGSVDDLDP